jgi:hypothetical protein
MRRKLPRDEFGWRIPGEGTVSRMIYQMMRDHIGRNEIARRLNKNPSTVGALMFEIRGTDHAAYSPYVKKLVAVLGMSLEEAIATERRLKP